MNPSCATARPVADRPPSAAFAGLAVFGLVAWAPIIGMGGALRLAPLAALAFLVASSARREVAIFAAVGSAPAAWLAGGLSPALVAPSHWSELGIGIGAGFWDLFPADSGGAGLPDWPRAVLAGLLGISWITAAGAARRHEVRGARTVAITALLAPAALSIISGVADDRAWLGATALGLALAWYRPRHLRGRLGAAAAGTAAVVAVTVASLVGASAASLAPSASSSLNAEFRRFDAGHSYGPLTGERDGTTLLRVRAREPAYWRARVLSRYDGRGWKAAQLPDPRAPQPGARQERIRVEVAALSSDNLVSPGTVVDVDGAGAVAPSAGDSVTVRSPLGRGASYQVKADVTRASRAELGAAPAARNPTLQAYTTVELAERPVGIPLIGSKAIPPQATSALAHSSYRRPLVLARRLSHGARTQLEVVRRVERFLERGFQYETALEDDERPLEDFLFSRRSGYCQHFAGAAALLLRLSGVPARVATGFAPGIYDPKRRTWRVRDLDAHSWVEVYFERHGWIPVDPTPSAGPAAIPPTAEPLRADSEGAGRLQVPPSAGALALAGFCAWAIVILRSRHPDRRSEATALLRTLARRASPPLPGATFAELGRNLELTYGPETARLATLLEKSQFSRSAVTIPRPRAVWRALRRDAGPVRGSCLAAQAVCLNRLRRPQARNTEHAPITPVSANRDRP
jgi:protein-glutamine gamma-glutamyltransferase